MAQQNTTSNSSNKSTKQRPKPLDSQSSIPGRHRISSELNENDPNLSPAEQYIRLQSQLSNPNTDLSENRAMASSRTLPSHNQMMNDWHEQQSNDRYKNASHYKYGPPPTSSKTSVYQRTNSQTNRYHTQTSTSSFCIDPKRKK